MEAGKEIRYRRIFGKDGRAVIIACDHGMFDGPHRKMEDIPGMLKLIGDKADGILMSPGILPYCKDYFGRRESPSAIVRLNFNSVFCFRWGYKDSVIAHLFTPEHAIATGADAVLVCLTLRTGSEARDARNAEIFAELCVRAHQLGLPVIGEYFPHSHLSKSPEDFHEEVLVGCRMLFELGADAIKTFHTIRFKEITSTCSIPVLGLGAEKTPTDYMALMLAEKLMNDGASGVVFGRNAVQATNPSAFIMALQEIVKHGAKASEMVKKYKLSE